MPDLEDRAGPVTVARFDWAPQALLARTRLAAAGIDTHVADSVMGSLCWQYGRALGGIRVQVSAEDAEDARAILDEPAPEADEPLQSATDELADRTLRAAIFGWVAVLPLLPYACWLLMRLLGGVEPLGPRARRKAALALALVLPACVLVIGVGAFAFARYL